MNENRIMFNIKNGRNVRNVGTLSLIILMIIFIGAGCDLNDADDDGDEFTGVSESYELQELNGSGVSGDLMLEERTDGTTQASLQLNGTESGTSYTAGIHENSVAEGGNEAIPLREVDGETGRSDINISDHNGTPITYDELNEFDGHVNIHRGDEVVAQADFGGNRLTGESFTYNLDEVDESGVSGEVEFAERRNQNTLVNMQVNGTVEGNEHPVGLNNGAVGAGGEQAFAFNNIDGATGRSATNIRADQTNDNFTFGSVETYDGHVGVQTSVDDTTPVAEGNIGANFDASGG